MKLSSIRMKVFLPTALVIAAFVTVALAFAITWQNREFEHVFGDNVATIASTSRFMIHSSADDFAKSRGYTFHRVAEGSQNKNSEANAVEREALKAFEADPKLDLFSKQVDQSGNRVMYVFAPGRNLDECMSCHMSMGVDTFKDRKAGDLVGAFGVSASMQELDSQKAKMLLAASIGGVVLIVSVLLLIGYFLDKVIVRPLKEFAVQSERVAEGDLTVVETPEISKRIDAADEIGQMARAFAKMIGGLRTIIGEVREASAAVASASTEISSSTEQMSAGSQEQSTQAVEVASAVEEMSKTIVENSRNAAATADTARKAKDAAASGGEIVAETLQGMTRIADVVRKSAVTVQALGKSSDHIGEITGVIGDIADQTNLLALNAAIEAARAGEQGRGFAVVADEVRKLAERTTKATREIGSMIKNIQTETTGAVQTMEAGTKEVEEGIALADKAGASLRGIGTISEQLMDMVSRIAAASEQQSSASEQISRNVEAISTVSGETAGSTQQISHAAEDLNRLTENLQGLVDRFRLPGEKQARPVRQTGRRDQGLEQRQEKARQAVNEEGGLVRYQA
ncbi:MAG: methyl-accepting chemotaxis protein [Ignavibacteriales bacterium]|nr:methyl-accepting chemotaxis protein [Ignavibacteriales bacterium]